VTCAHRFSAWSVVQTLAIAAFVILGVACASMPSGQRDTTTFATVQRAIDFVSARSSLPPIFVVEGAIVDDPATIPTDHVVSASVPAVPAGHCGPAYAVNGDCRPVIFVRLRLRRN
jgi:hypothetical protein